MSDIYFARKETLTNMANTIREISGVTGELKLDEMFVKLEAENENLDSNLNTQGGLIDQIQAALVGKAAATPTLQEKTVTPSTSAQSVTPDSGYDGLSKVTVNAMATATQATPSVSVNSSGLITASATQTAGYVSAGTKSGTKQLTTQAAKTVTPSKSSQTAVASGVYTTGTVTVAAIPNEYITTTDANAASGDIMKDKTAYVNGSKVTGSFTIDSEINTVDSLVSQIATALQGKAAGGGSGGGAVEMCTATLRLSFTGMRVVMYQSNGEIIHRSGSAMAFGSMSPSVDKGSVICVASMEGTTLSSVTYNSATNLAKTAATAAYIVVNEPDTFTIT